MLLVSGMISAQTGTASVRGTVSDPQGNVIPNASVKLVQVSTNFERVQQSTAEGDFAFELITPGEYRLEVTAPGFEMAKVSGIRAMVGKSVDVHAQMSVGGITESVQVTAQEIMINTQDASLGNNFISSQITQLPLEARNIASLLTLQPQVTREGYVAGARSDQANITLDGVDINEAQTNALDSPVLRLNAEAVEEFRVTTTNANAAQGRSSGAQVNLVTKGGTNSFHGALSEYHRNTIFTANDYFNNLSGTDRPKLIRNTFGGAISGPIYKDRAFFFYSYEGRRDASSESVVRTVPLASLGRGEVRYVNPGGTITTITPAQMESIYGVPLNPAALSLLADAASRYPANDFTVGDSEPGVLLNVGGYRFNATTPLKLNSHSARLDFKLTDNQQLMVRGNYIHDLVTRVSQFPDTPSPDLWEHPYGWVVGHTWTPSNRVVNNFRWGMTRQAFSSQGDSQENAFTFRFVYSPFLYTRELSRVTPVHNFTDDVSITSGNHTWQFGTNIRRIKNARESYANSYDFLTTNPSFYNLSGSSVSNPIDRFSPIGDGMTSVVQGAATAVLGGLSQYEAAYIFDRDGTITPGGTPSARDFRTEEYDFYVQDSWKISRNFTLTAGLRYSLGRPVYEANGFEVKPNIPLDEYFQRRLDGAAAGQPYYESLQIDLAGPANDRTPMYRWDKNNFQPRVAFAWSPQADGGLMGFLFGSNNQSSIRGGFALTNDYYGQQLAVSFDLNNTLGFSSSTVTSANTFDPDPESEDFFPAPAFTGLGQGARGLYGITDPSQLVFPLEQPADGSRRIEQSLDEGLVAPKHYSWNLTFERQLPAGLMVQASYVGRAARNLLATRDVMAINNLVDPTSKTDWYTAAGILAQAREQGKTIADIAPIPYFQNLFPGLATSSRTATQSVYRLILLTDADYTFVQDIIDYRSVLGPDVPAFYNPQYGALSAWGTIGNSNYHGGSISLRQRLAGLTWDFNYTLSHSIDDASGLQVSTAYAEAFILNPIRQSDNYANSDFDVRHQINANGVWELPIGQGKAFGGNMPTAADAFIGGWQISSIFRWNTGLPIFSPYDDARWATNWNAQSSGVRTRSIQSCPTRGDTPKLFGCDPTAMYQSWRNARPGETGDRNVIRLPGYVALDLGLAKSIKLPFEGHHLQFRWDVFNVSNTQRFFEVDTSRTGFGLVLDPAVNEPPPNFSNFTGIQGTPRVMQFGLRYSF